MKTIRPRKRAVRVARARNRRIVRELRHPKKSFIVRFCEDVRDLGMRAARVLNDRVRDYLRTQRNMAYGEKQRAKFLGRA